MLQQLRGRRPLRRVLQSAGSHKVPELFAVALPQLRLLRLGDDKEDAHGV